MAKQEKKLEGMYVCKTKDGKEEVYHASTIEAVKGTPQELTVVKEVKKYTPKKAKA